MTTKLFAVTLVLVLCIPAFGQLAAPGADNSPKVEIWHPIFKFQDRSAEHRRPT
jgi:hypothetical protein